MAQVIEIPSVLQVLLWLGQKYGGYFEQQPYDSLHQDKDIVHHCQFFYQYRQNNINKIFSCFYLLVPDIEATEKLTDDKCLQTCQIYKLDEHIYYILSFCC